MYKSFMQNVRHAGHGRFSRANLCVSPSIFMFKLINKWIKVWCKTMWVAGGREGGRDEKSARILLNHNIRASWVRVAFNFIWIFFGSILNAKSKCFCKSIDVNAGAWRFDNLVVCARVLFTLNTAKFGVLHLYVISTFTTHKSHIRTSKRAANEIILLDFLLVRLIKIIALNRE